MEPTLVQDWVCRAMDRFMRSGDDLGGSAIASVGMVTNDHGHFVTVEMTDGDQFVLQVIRGTPGEVLPQAEYSIGTTGRGPG